MDAYEQELERFLSGSLRPSEVRAAGAAAGVDPSRWGDVQASAASPAADTWKRREAVRLFLSSRYGRDISDLEHDGYRAAWFGDGKDDTEAYAQVSAFFPAVPAGRLIAADSQPEPKRSGIMARIDRAIAPEPEALSGFLDTARGLTNDPERDTRLQRGANAATQTLTTMGGGLVAEGLSLVGLKQTARAVADMTAFRASFYEPSDAARESLKKTAGSVRANLKNPDWWDVNVGQAAATMGAFTLTGLAGMGAVGGVIANPLVRAAVVGAAQGIGEAGVEAGGVLVEGASRRAQIRERQQVLDEYLDGLSEEDRTVAIMGATGAAQAAYEDELARLNDPDAAARYANQVLRRNIALNAVLGALQMGAGASAVKQFAAKRTGAVLGALGLLGLDQAIEQEQEQYQEGWSREAVAAWAVGRAAALDLMPAKTLRAFLNDDPEGKDIALATLLQSGRSVVVNAASQWGELKTLAEADNRRRDMLAALEKGAEGGNRHAAALLAELDRPETRKPGAAGLAAFGERLRAAASKVISRTQDEVDVTAPERIADIDPDAMLDDAGRVEADDIAAQIEEDREALAEAEAEEAAEATPEPVRDAAPAEPTVDPAAAADRASEPAVPAVAQPEAVRRGLAVAERLAAANPAAGRVEVIADADVPAEVRAAQKSQGKRIAGYRRGDGTMVVVADNLDPDRVVGEVVRVWAHEQAHGGLRALFNGDTARVDAFLDWMQGQITPEALVGMLPETGMSTEEAGRSPDRALRIASDEYMARLAEKVAADPSSLNQTQQTLWRRVLAMVRDGLRSLAGVDVRLSEAELQDIAVTLLRAAGVERLPDAARMASRRQIEAPPVVAFLQEQGGLMPKSRARDPGGEYEGQPTAAELAPFAGSVFARSGGLSPDQAAQMMADRGMIADAYPETLWAALRGAVKDARAGRAAEVEAVKDGKAAERFDAELRQPGAKGMAVEVDSLRTGDVLTSRGERLAVTDIDADTGAVRLSGGARYGEQTVEAGATLYPETIERAADDDGTDEDVRFSLADADRDYMAAVERGDMDAAQRMVDEAARAAGYTIGPVWHGGGARVYDFSAGSQRGVGLAYFTDDKEVAKRYAFGGGINGKTSEELRQRLEDEQSSGRFEERIPTVSRVFLRIDNAIGNDTPAMEIFGGDRMAAERVLGEWAPEFDEQLQQEYEDNGNVPDEDFWSMADGLLDQGNGYVAEDDYALSNAPGLKSRIALISTDDSHFGYDGWKYSDAEAGGTTFVVVNGYQIKSADPVTRDDAGRVIPLSERFNDASPDIRFSLVDIDLGPRERVLAAAVAGDMLRGRSVGEKAVARRLREIGERTDAAGAVVSAAKMAAAELRAQRLDAASDTEILAALAGRVLRDRYRGNIAKTAEVGADQQAEMEKSYRRIEGWRREYVRRMAEKRSGLSDEDLAAAGQKDLEKRLAKVVDSYAPKKTEKPPPAEPRGDGEPAAVGESTDVAVRDPEDFDAAANVDGAAEAAALAMPAAVPSTDPVDLAALKEAIVTEATAKLARDGYVVRAPNTDPVLRREVAVTWARLLRNAAFDHLRPGARREWIREALKSLELAPPTMKAMDRRVSQLAYWLSREADRTTAEAFVRQLERLLGLKAVKGRTSGREELIRRKIEPRAKAWLRLVKDVYAISEAKRDEALDILRGITEAFDHGNLDAAQVRERLATIAPSVAAEPSWQGMEPGDLLDDVARALAGYGAIASRPAGEIADAVERLKADYAEGLARVEAARERRRERLKPFAEALRDGMRRLPEVPEQSARKWINSFVRGGFSFYNGMHDLMRYARGESGERGRAGIKALALQIQAAHDDYTRRIYGSRTALEKAVRDAYGTKDVEGVLRRLEEPVEAYRRFSRNQERPRALSKANLLFIVAALEQRQYGANAEKYGRDGDYLAQIRGVLSPGDLAMLDWLRGWYRAGRVEISARSMEVLGVPVVDPDPLYHPVRVSRPDAGLDEVHYTLQLAPQTFELRRRHGWDIDETASVVGLFHAYADANARFLSHVELAQDLRYVYGHPETRRVLEEFAGKESARQVVQHITAIAAGRERGTTEAGAEILSRVRAATTLAVMSWNVGAGLRQLTAVPAFALAMGPTAVAKHMGWSLAHPAEWFAAVKEMRADPAFREWATKGYSEQVDNAMRRRGAKSPGVVGRRVEALGRLLRLGMAVQSAGAQAAVFTVAPSFYAARRQAGEAAGLSPDAARLQAMTETMWMVHQTQGSSQVAMLSPMWSGSGGGSGMMRWLMQFTGPTAQLYEWEARVLREFVADTPGVRRRVGNYLVVNHVLIPAVYMAMKALWEGVLGDWNDDPEDELEQTAKEALAMMMVGPFGGVVLFGAVIESAVSKSVGLYGRGAGVPGYDLAERFIGGSWSLAQHLTVDFDLEEALKDWDRVMRTVSAPYRDIRKAAENWGR